MVAEHLKKYGIKPSVQRIAIMDYLLSHKTHPTADEIYSALQPTMPTLSKTTVYNTMKLFVEYGAALGLNIEEKNLRFDGDTSLHAHFICLECGAVHDFFPHQIEALEDAQRSEVDGFKITETQVYYKGYCKTCLENKRN
jgi:Fe2+ or Zn2+ uptake regulation protein